MNIVVDSDGIFQIASSLRRLQLASQPADGLLGVNKAGLIAFWTLGHGRSTPLGGWASRIGLPQRGQSLTLVLPITGICSENRVESISNGGGSGFAISPAAFRAGEM
jgi:hypothetical protein